MAVCSTPSSPLGPGVPGMVPLLKLRLTGKVGARATKGQNQNTGIGVAPWWYLGNSAPSPPSCCGIPATVHPPDPSPRIQVLTFGDAVLSREQALLDEPLQHRAH